MGYTKQFLSQGAASLQNRSRWVISNHFRDKTWEVHSVLTTALLSIPVHALMTGNTLNIYSSPPICINNNYIYTTIIIYCFFHKGSCLKLPVCLAHVSTHSNFGSPDHIYVFSVLLRVGSVISLALVATLKGKATQ